MKTTYTVLRDTGHENRAISLASRLAWYVRQRIAIAFPCDRCGAKPWERCTTNTGKIASTEHGSRDDQARAVMVESAEEVGL